MARQVPVMTEGRAIELVELDLVIRKRRCVCVCVGGYVCVCVQDAVGAHFQVVGVCGSYERDGCRGSSNK